MTDGYVHVYSRDGALADYKKYGGVWNIKYRFFKTEFVFEPQPVKTSLAKFCQNLVNHITKNNELKEKFPANLLKLSPIFMKI